MPKIALSLATQIVIIACICAQQLFFAGQPAMAGGSFAVSGNSDPKALRLQAFQKYLDGDFESARHLYEQAINSAKQAYGANSSFLGDLYFEVGSISLEDGQFPIAEKYLKLAVQHKPCSIVARVKYAEVLSMRGMSDEALSQIEQALKREPHNPVAQQARARWMMMQASPKNPKGAASNVAATWECYRLHQFGKEAVAQTLASLMRHQKELPAKSTLALVRAHTARIEPVKEGNAGAEAARAVPSSKEEKEEAKPLTKHEATPDGTLPARKQAIVELHKSRSRKPAVVEQAKPRSKKPVVADQTRPRLQKPKAEPKPPAESVVAAGPKPVKDESKEKPAHIKKEAVSPIETVAAAPPQMKPASTSGKRSKGQNGLVPPPPPSVPVFTPPVFVSAPPPPSGFAEFRLQTKAEKVGENKPKPEKKKKKAPQPDVEQEPDFLIDWGGADGQKKHP